MSKQAFELLDLESGLKYTLETSTDILPSDITLLLPDRNGTLAIVKDVDDLSTKLVTGDITVGDSKKLDGKALSEIALSDMSNVTLTPEMINSLRGFTGSAGSAGTAGPIGLQGGTGYTGSVGNNGTTGYTGSTGFTGSKGDDGAAGSAGPIGPQGYVGSKGTDGTNGYTGSQGINGTNGYTGSTGSQGITGYTGSKGDTGQGFSISTTFNSLAELLAGTTTNDTFALVAGTLSQDDEDYGKLYHRFNNAWTYITDMSIKGAAGITGPQGNIGYTGSVGFTGSAGINGIQGYTGSKGTDGGSLEPIIDCFSDGSTITLDLSRSTSFITQINPGDNVVIKPINVTSSVYDSVTMMNLYTALYYILEVIDGGQGIITWTSTSGSPVKWSNGIAPVLTTTGKDILGFISVNGGIHWDGVVLSKDSK